MTANLLATPEMVPAEASRPVYRGGKAAKAKAMADAAVEDSGYAETGLDEAGYDLTPIVVTASRTENLWRMPMRTSAWWAARKLNRCI